MSARHVGSGRKEEIDGIVPVSDDLDVIRNPVFFEREESRFSVGRTRFHNEDLDRLNTFRGYGLPSGGFDLKKKLAQCNLQRTRELLDGVERRVA